MLIHIFREIIILRNQNLKRIVSNANSNSQNIWKLRKICILPLVPGTALLLVLVCYRYPVPLFWYGTCIACILYQCNICLNFTASIVSIICHHMCKEIDSLRTISSIYTMSFMDNVIPYTFSCSCHRNGKRIDFLKAQRGEGEKEK
jgi:hypothetical protein